MTRRGLFSRLAGWFAAAPAVEELIAESVDREALRLNPPLEDVWAEPTYSFSFVASPPILSQEQVDDMNACDPDGTLMTRLMRSRIDPSLSDVVESTE